MNTKSSICWGEAAWARCIWASAASGSSRSRLCRQKSLHRARNAQRFEREIEALKTLDHPNVVHLIDSGVDNDRRYMIMDFIDGQDLTHVLREKGMFSPEVAYDIVKQIGAALTYIHSREADPPRRHERQHHAES
ncbi:MAG: protein kinase [Chloroflexi bacterium]|nr:protein kinase [Chloroflexota bacterium]